MALNPAQRYSLQPDALWGEKTLTLRFAGIGFRINGLDTEQFHALSNLYAPLQPSKSEDIDILETSVRQHILPKRSDKYFANKDNIYTPLMQTNAHGVEFEGYGFQASINLTPSLHGILNGDDRDLLATPLVFENYLRIFAAYAILMRGGLLLHSAGFVVDSNAYLFLGRSGAGKTTLTRVALANGMKILSDDINIVFPTEDGSFAAGAVPFAGELGHKYLEQGGRYPLKGIFWLEKSPSLECADIAASAQFAKLLACCPVVNADPQQLDRIMAAGMALLKSAPMRVLRFRRDEAFPDLQKILRAQGDNEE